MENTYDSLKHQSTEKFLKNFDSPRSDDKDFQEIQDVGDSLAVGDNHLGFPRK